MASCGIKFIKMGKNDVPFNKVVEALNESKKFPELEEAIIKGYAKLPTKIPMKEWSKWFKRIHDVSKGDNITESDIVGYDGNSKAKRLTSLLNFEGYVETVKGEKTYSLLPETVHTINSLKRQLLTSGQHLNEKQVAGLINSVEAALFVSKATSQTNKLKSQAKKNLAKKFGSARELFPILKKFLSLDLSGVPIELREQYLGILKKLSKREAVPDIKSVTKELDAIKDIIEKSNAPKEYKGVKKEDLEEKENRIAAILNTEVDTSKLELREEREAAEILKNLTEEDLAELDNLQLKHLQASLININNGFMPHAGYNLILDIDANRVSELIANLADNADSYGSWAQKLYGKLKSGKEFNEIAQIIRSSPATVVDQVFGNKGRDIFYNTFRRLAVASERYNAAAKAIDTRQDKLYSKLQKKFGRGNKVVKILYKLKLIEKQREFESNPDQYSAKQYLDAIIAEVEGGNKKNYTDKDVEILRELEKEFTKDGEFNLKKLEENLSKEEQEILDENRELAIAMGDKLIFTAGVIRGERPDVLQNYSHSNVLGEKGDKDAQDYQQRFYDGSSKAGSIQERNKAGESAPVISLDVLGDASRSAKQILLDFHMTPQVRVVNRGLKRAQEKAEGKKAKEAIQGLRDAVDESIKRDLSKRFAAYNMAEAVVKKIVRNFYVAQLSSIQRAAAELVSNSAFALSVAPSQVLKGISSLKGISNGATILNNLGSFQTSKLFEHGTFSGKEVEASAFEGKRPKRQQALSPTAAMVEAISDYGNKIGKHPAALADKILTTPDKLIARPIWFGEFAQQFKKITGQEPDFKKIEANDEAYITKFSKALKEATRKADDMSALAGASSNQYVGISKIKISPDDSVAKQIYKTFSGYLMTFMIWEASTFREGVLSAVGKGAYSKKQGAAILVGASARMSVYFPMVQMLNRLIANAIFGEDDEEEDIAEMFKFEVLGSLLTLLTQGRLSGYPRAAISFATEYLNEKYLEGLRNGEEYDPYKHSLTFNLITDADLRYGRGLKTVLFKMTGPLAKPLKNLTEQGDKLIMSKKEEKRKEAMELLLLQSTGYFGVNPFAREMEKIYKAYKRANK